MSDVLQIVILAGPDRPERAVFGLAAGLAAAASGVNVHIVLSMHGAYWASPDAGTESSVAGFPAVSELFEQLRDAGATLEGCTSCLEQYCISSRDADGLRTTRTGITRVGLGLVAIRMAEHRTLVC